MTQTLIENSGSECCVRFEIGDALPTAKLPGRVDEAKLDRAGLAINRG